jgi:DNA-binding NtrC family response regulator
MYARCFLGRSLLVSGLFFESFQLWVKTMSTATLDRFEGSRFVASQSAGHAANSAAQVTRMVENELRAGDFSQVDLRMERIQELVDQHLLEPAHERRLLLLAARYLEGADQVRRARRMIGALLSDRDILKGDLYAELRKFRTRSLLNAGDLVAARWEIDRTERVVTETREGLGNVREFVDRDLSRVSIGTWLLSAEVSLAEGHFNSALQCLANGLQCMREGLKTADETAMFELLSAVVCIALGDDAGIPALAYLYRVHVISSGELLVEAAVRARIAAATGDMERTVGISQAEAARWRGYGPDVSLIQRYLSEGLVPPSDLLSRLPPAQAFSTEGTGLGDVIGEAIKPEPVEDLVAVAGISGSLPMSFLFEAHGLVEMATHIDYHLKTGPLVVDWSECAPDLIEEAIGAGAISDLARKCQRGTIYFNNGSYVDACFECAESQGMNPIDVIFELMRISMAGLPGACGRQLAWGPEAARVPEVVNLRPNNVNLDLMRRLDHLRTGEGFETLDDGDIDAALAEWSTPALPAASGNGKSAAPVVAEVMPGSHVGIDDVAAGEAVSFVGSVLAVTESVSVASLHEALRRGLLALGLELFGLDIVVSETGQSLLGLMPGDESFELWGESKAAALAVQLSLPKGQVVDCGNAVRVILNAASQRLRTMPGQLLRSPIEVPDFVAEDIVTQGLLSQLRDFALLDGVDQPVKHILLRGERGVGKELLAKAIHGWSGRSGNVFMPVNFGAISKELAAAEVFGAKKGSYTGSDRDRPGYIQSAEGGTLFLDELDEASENLQALLKRVVQFGTFNGVGSPELKTANVRFVAATNVLGSESSIKRDLRDRFLEVTVPPLRERRGDIRPLAEIFAAQCKSTSDATACGYTLSDAVLCFLETLDWPGNVRQLENVIHRSCAVIKSEDDLTLDLFERSANEEGARLREVEIDGEKFTPFARGETLKMRRRKMDKLAVTWALVHCRGNTKHAAQVLGMTKTGLTDRMRELGVSNPSPSS